MTALAAPAAIAAALFYSASCIGFAHAADVPGSKDPPGFKRYEGSQIIHHAENRYSAYILDRDGGWGKTENAEGEIARTWRKPRARQNQPSARGRDC